MQRNMISFPSRRELVLSQRNSIPIALMYLFVLLYSRRFDFLQHIRPSGDLWWSDSHQELLRSFYVSHGLTLYSDVAINHMPGLILAYSVFLRYLGFGTIPPSLDTLVSIEVASIAISGLLQSTLFMLSFLAAGASIIFSCVGSVLLILFFWEAYGHFLPLAETTLIPLIALATVLNWRISVGQYDSSVLAFMLLVGLLIYTLSISLATGVLVLLWGLWAMFTVCFKYRRASQPRSILPLKANIVPLALVSVFLCAYGLYVLFNVNITGMYYWNVTFNREVEPVHLLENLFTHVTLLARALFDISYMRSGSGISFPFVGTPLFLLASLAALAWVQMRANGLGSTQAVADRSKQIANFSLAAFIGFLSLGWRFPGDYASLKLLPAVGISVGIVVVIVTLALRGHRAAGRGRTTMLLRECAEGTYVSAALTAVVPVIVAGIVLKVTFGVGSDNVSPRPNQLDATNVCRLGDEREDCLCALQAFYDARRFLEYDVKPCSGYSPDHFHVLQKSEIESRRFREAAENTEKVAFLIGRNAEDSTMFGIPRATYDLIVSARRCLPLSPIHSICGK